MTDANIEAAVAQAGIVEIRDTPLDLPSHGPSANSPPAAGRSVDPEQVWLKGKRADVTRRAQQSRNARPTPTRARAMFEYPCAGRAN